MTKKKTSCSRRIPKRIQGQMPTLPDNWESPFVRYERQELVLTALTIIGVVILVLVWFAR